MSGLATLWSDLKEAFVPAVALADNDEDESKEEEAAAQDSEENEDADGDESEDEEEDDEDEDDEDDEDDLVDPLDTLRTKFSETVCHDAKHHFEECVARVTAAQEEEGYEDREYKEDCVEEFFHLQHCLDQQIAPILFDKLK